MICNLFSSYFCNGKRSVRELLSSSISSKALIKSRSGHRHFLLVFCKLFFLRARDRGPRANPQKQSKRESKKYIKRLRLLEKRGAFLSSTSCHLLILIISFQVIPLIVWVYCSHLTSVNYFNADKIICLQTAMFIFILLESFGKASYISEFIESTLKGVAKRIGRLSIRIRWHFPCDTRRLRQNNGFVDGLRLSSLVKKPSMESRSSLL